MLRKDWKFQYIAKDLAKAAATKRDHHAACLDWWNKQQESVIAEVREKGLEVSETLAMQYGSTPAGAQIIVKTNTNPSSTSARQRSISTPRGPKSTTAGFRFWRPTPARRLSWILATTFFSLVSDR